MTCSEGESAVITSVPTALARMCSIRSRTTLRFTSASSMRHADLAQCFLNVFFGQRALAAKILEGTLEFVGKVFKHRSNSSVSVKAADSEQ